jgi:hypothetical protein
MADEQVNDGRVQADVRAEEAAKAAKATTSEPAGDGLDDRTKDELLEEAEARGVEVKTSATKAEILAALRG